MTQPEPVDQRHADPDGFPRPSRRSKKSGTRANFLALVPSRRGIARCKSAAWTLATSTF